MGITQVTNQTDISLALAIWLMHDEYDYIDKPNYISVTGLMKPLRHIVLGPRLPKGANVRDVESMIPSALGHAIHDSIEKAWLKHSHLGLAKLGYPNSLIEKVHINPTDAAVQRDPEIIPIYLEQRLFRNITVDGITYTIGGKFDMVTEGILQDAKSTSTYAWTKGGKDDDYILQKSMYRWLDAGQPFQKITEDYGRINFIFTDWSRGQARQNPLYPQSRVCHRDYPLTSIQGTEAWIVEKIRLIREFKDTPEAKVPHCTPEELWQSESVHKYFSDKAKADAGGRATRNFDTDLAAANAYMAEKGKGVVKTFPGEPKRCGYCPVFDICSQKDAYFHD